MKTSRTSIDGVHLRSECVDESIEDEIREIMRFLSILVLHLVSKFLKNQLQVYTKVNKDKLDGITIH